LVMYWGVNDIFKKGLDKNDYSTIEGEHMR